MVDAVLSELKVEVKEEQAGIEPVTMTILIGIGTNVASHALIKVWEDVIWPRVRDRLDDDALGNRKETKDDSGPCRTRLSALAGRETPRAAGSRRGCSARAPPRSQSCSTLRRSSAHPFRMH